MEILSDIKAIIKSPDEFVKDRDKYKYAFLYSTALKIFAFTAILIKTCFPTYFAITSIALFCASLYIDYKIISNIEDLFFSIFQNNINNNPYQNGYFLGRLSASLIKINFIQRVYGFLCGFKRELFN